MWVRGITRAQVILRDYSRDRIHGGGTPLFPLAYKSIIVIAATDRFTSTRSPLCRAACPCIMPSIKGVTLVSKPPLSAREVGLPRAGSDAVQRGPRHFYRPIGHGAHQGA